MPRRNHLNFRHNSQADKEKRDTKVIKAFRMLDTDNSSDLAGVVHDLRRDNSLPALKSVPGTHAAYILDPRIVRKEFNNGFSKGFSFSEAKQRIEDEDQKDVGHKQTVSAKVGKISILGSTDKNHRIIAAYVESSTLVAERKAIYEILGNEGLKGFGKKEYKKPGAPLIVLGIMEEPVHDKGARTELEEAVETSILIHQSAELKFGPLQVV